MHSSRVFITRRPTNGGAFGTSGPWDPACALSWCYGLHDRNEFEGERSGGLESLESFESFEPVGSFQSDKPIESDAAESTRREGERGRAERRLRDSAEDRRERSRERGTRERRQQG